MKKLFFVFLFIFSMAGYSVEPCEFESSCDGDFEGIAPAVIQDECPLDDPLCPLPGDAVEMTEMKATENVLFWNCVSSNYITRRYGSAVSINHYLASLWAYQRCRASSGQFGYFCQRPTCYPVWGFGRGPGLPGGPGGPGGGGPGGPGGGGPGGPGGGGPGGPGPGPHSN